MENQELGNPEKLPRLSRREFLKLCSELGFKIGAASIASGSLGLITWKTVMSPEEENIPTVPAATSKNDIAKPVIPRADTGNNGKSVSTQTNRVIGRVAKADADENINAESVRSSAAQFTDRLNKTLIYDILGISKDHTRFWIDRDRKTSYPRNKAVILDPGIDFSGLKDKYSEWEKWVVATNPTTTPDKIEKELTKAKSPLAGLGKFIYDLGAVYGVDPNFFMAICYLESVYATVKSVALSNLNTGSLRRSPFATGAKNGFVDFPSYEVSIIAWYELLVNRYFIEWNKMSVDEIIQIYAPPSENDTTDYIRKVKSRMDYLREDKRIKAEALGILSS